MKCLCCAKPITNASSEEERTSWHTRCVKRFFGTNTLPKIDLNEETLEKMANEIASKGLTVAGVQKKLSLHLSQDVESRLTIVDYPSGYILKPQIKEFPYLPEYEDVTMRMAEIAGIQTVPHALIMYEGVYAYITKRIDRDIHNGKFAQYAMEDFCQLANRLTRDKYKGSYEKCARIIKKYSSRKGFDLSELFMRIVFSYIVGNSDMHFKNFSMIETKPANRKFVLSRAYDFLPVNVILPEDTDEMALVLNRKKKNLTRKDFFCLADYCDIKKNAAEKMIQNILSKESKFIECINGSKLNSECQEKLIVLMQKRIETIRS